MGPHRRLRRVGVARVDGVDQPRVLGERHALGTVPRRCERTGRLHPRAMTPL
jgi:hypothetical protein